MTSILCDSNRSFVLDALNFLHINMVTVLSSQTCEEVQLHIAKYDQVMSVIYFAWTRTKVGATHLMYWMSLTTAVIMKGRTGR